MSVSNAVKDAAGAAKFERDKTRDAKALVESAQVILDNPHAGPGVKALIGAAAAIVRVEKDIHDMIQQLDSHEDMAKLIRSGLESLDIAATRMNKVYHRFIQFEVERLTRIHNTHKAQGDVEPGCLWCELETATPVAP